MEAINVVFDEKFVCYNNKEDPEKYHFKNQKLSMMKTLKMLSLRLMMKLNKKTVQILK